MPGPRPCGAGCAAIGDVATIAASAIADKVAVVADLNGVIVVPLIDIVALKAVGTLQSIPAEKGSYREYVLTGIPRMTPKLARIFVVSRALGVPPMLLMDFGRATWGNSEQMAQAFLTFTILPRMRLWAGAVPT